MGMLIIVCSVLIEGSRIEDGLRGPVEARYTIIKPRVFEAIGVISFAFVRARLSFTPRHDRFLTCARRSTSLDRSAITTRSSSTARFRHLH